MNHIEILWNEVRNDGPYPKDAHLGLDGVDLVLIDSNIASCASSYFANSGTLDKQRTDLLTFSVKKLQEQFENVPNSAKPYFLKRKQLGEEILKYVEHNKSIC